MKNTSSQPNIPHSEEFYKHYKTGKLCQILATATHTETGEPLIIYQALYKHFQIFACPLAIFTKCTEDGKKHFYQVRPKTAHTDIGIHVDTNPSDTSHFNSSTTTQNTISTPFKKTNSSAKMPDLSDHSKTPNLENKPDCYSDYNNSSQKDIHALMEKFYDTETYDEKLDLLYAMKSQLTDIMLTNIAISLDIVAADGTLEERFQSIVSCLNTMKRYQITRLR